MRVKRHAGVESFLSEGGGFLSSREAEHNLLLGLCSRLRRDPKAYGSDPYLAVVRDGSGEVSAVAMRTAPYNLILSDMADLSPIEMIARDTRDAFETLPGVLGPKRAAAAFAREWEGLTGQVARLTMAQRIYRADSVTVPSGVPGHERTIRPEERALVLAWMAAFQEEALPPESPREDLDAILDRRFAEPDAGLLLWDDQGPVSLAGYSGSTPNGIRVGPVYTPPELRGRGYASALVAAMTKALLDSGRRFCFLFTDLANPTSNRIYRRVGYRPVTDVDHYTFD